MIELNKIYNDDCMDIIPDIPDKHFELATVDVSYGINRGGGKMGGDCLAKNKDYHSFDDSRPPNQVYFNELFRVSKNQIIWGANHFISKIPFDSPGWIVWDKVNGNNNFADAELAWTSFNTAVRIFRYKWQGMLQGNMKYKESRIHPCQKPVDLYRWLLKNYAKPGDKILDTHAGSCSFVIACIDIGFEYLAIEKDPIYYQEAVERVEKFKQIKTERGELF